MGFEICMIGIFEEKAVIAYISHIILAVWFMKNQHGQNGQNYAENKI